MEPDDPLHQKTLAARRVRVYGCSPGCLLFSLAASVILTILVNVMIRLL